MAVDRHITSRRGVLGAIAAAPVALSLVPTIARSSDISPWDQAPLGNRRPPVDRSFEIVSVFDFIPKAEQRAIRAGTSAYDCTGDIHKARSVVDGSGKTLHFPGGTYCVGEVEFSGTNYILDTAGVTFRQKSGLTTKGDGLSHPIIRFPMDASNIAVGDIRLIGNIATDHNEFSHGIAVASAKTITIGNVYGENIRGDVLYTYGRTTSEAEYQRELVTGVIRGKNIYRCIVAMVGGEATIAGVIQDGPVGYRDVDFEPNAGGAYQPVSARIGFIRGSVVQVTSDDPKILNRSINIGTIDLDGRRIENSTPGYPSHGGSAAIGLSINRTDTVEIGSLVIRNYPSYPVSLGSLWKSVRIEMIDFAQCNTAERVFKSVIIQQGTAGNGVLTIGKIQGVLAGPDKMILRSNAGLLQVSIGSVAVSGGLFGYFLSGQVDRIKLDCGDGAGDICFNSCRNMKIGPTEITNARKVWGFSSCANLTLTRWTAKFGAGLDYAGKSTNIVALNSSINGSAPHGTAMLVNGAFRIRAKPR